jgi:hypothetical protein
MVNKVTYVRRVSALIACVAFSVAGCSGGDSRSESAGADKFTKVPNSCSLVGSDVVRLLTGSPAPRKYINGSAAERIQECSWSTLPDVRDPRTKLGQVTVFVDMQNHGSMGSGFQHIEKVYKAELDGSGCAPLAGVAVDKSCVFPGKDLRLVSFRTSNLFVRITCSVRNPDACAGGKRSDTARLLAKDVLQHL